MDFILNSYWFYVYIISGVLWAIYSIRLRNIIYELTFLNIVFIFIFFTLLYPFSILKDILMINSEHRIDKMFWRRR